MAQLYLGTARARLGPAAAIIDVERGMVAACEENRLTRAVDSGTVGPPELAVGELLRFLGRTGREALSAEVAESAEERASAEGAEGAEGRSSAEDAEGAEGHKFDDVSAEGAEDAEKGASAEDARGTSAERRERAYAMLSAWSASSADTRASGRTLSVGPHLAHAAYALVASGLRNPLVVVCGSDVTAWHGAGRLRLGSVPAFSDEYERLTRALGFRATRDEHLVEALARGGHREAAEVQRRLGDELLQMLDGLKARTRARSVCLSGGLFFNTFFTSLVASSNLFDDVYVPPHPGRNGAAMGAALVAGGRADVSSPYLGPSYTDQEIKATLENCKLSFDLLHEDRLFDLVLHQLSRGRMVGWFHGRLEWGPRALGHRSVLADPFAPHVLENLNGFLKRRPAFRAYGVSVPASQLDEIFELSKTTARPEPRPADSRTPRLPASPFMQYEYRPRDLDKFRTILPPGVETLRVHTVDEREPRFLRLLQRWGDLTGAPVLVNTSFNGFHEPLVCSPRDAIRVFYGTGVDLLAMENFVLRK